MLTMSKDAFKNIITLCARYRERANFLAKIFRDAGVSRADLVKSIRAYSEASKNGGIKTKDKSNARQKL